MLAITGFLIPETKSGRGANLVAPVTSSVGRGESPASWGPAAVAGSLVFTVLLLWGGQCFLCHRQHLLSLSSRRTAFGPGASMPPNTGLPRLPPPQLVKACSAQLLPRGPLSCFWASFQPFLQLTLPLLCGQRRTLGENLVLPWKSRGTLPSPPPRCLGRSKHSKEWSCGSPLLCPGRALHISFPRSGGALLKEDLMVGFLVHPPWQLPRGKGLPFARRALRVPVGTGL